MAARMRSRSPLRSASSNGRVLQEIVPEAAARGREVSPATLEAIATMESIESLGEGWTDGGRRCYICKRYTLSPLKLDLLGKEQADCPHVACSYECLQKLNSEWTDIKYELEDLERELPSGE